MALNFQNTDQITAEGVGTVEGTARDVAGTFGLVATLDVDTISGSSGTLDVKMQHSPNQDDWYDIPSGAFAQVTDTTGDETLTFPDGTLYRFVRAHYTIGAGDRLYTARTHMEGRS